MIPELIFDKEKNRVGYDGTDEEFEEFCELLDTYSDFSFIAYRSGVNCLLSCFDGFEDWNQPSIIDYSYGLTFNSINNYIQKTYGDSNPNKYLIEVHLMSFDYEKPWKFGTYIDKDGNKTHKDYYEIDEYKEDIKTADIDGNFIAFSVYDLNNKK